MVRFTNDQKKLWICVLLGRRNPCKVGFDCQEKTIIGAKARSGQNDMIWKMVTNFA